MMKKHGIEKYIITGLTVIGIMLCTAACFDQWGANKPTPVPDGGDATAAPTDGPAGDTTADPTADATTEPTSGPDGGDATSEPTEIPGQAENDGIEQEAADKGKEFTFLDGEKNIYAGTIGNADADIIIIPNMSDNHATIKFMSDLDTPSYNADIVDGTIMKYSDDEVRFTIYQQEDGMLVGVRTVGLGGAEPKTENITLKYMRVELLK